MVQRIIVDTTKIGKKSDMVAAEMEGQIVMLSVTNGKYYGLDSISSRIWNLLDVPRCVTDLVDLLVTEYDVESQQCKLDVLELLTYLYNEDLVEIL